MALSDARVIIGTYDENGMPNAMNAAWGEIYFLLNLLWIRFIEYLFDSMLKKIKKSSIIRAIANKKMLLLSVVKPDAGFNVGIAMMRNRYIYAQSSGTVVVRSEYNKGGTWAGAVENLKYGWCKELCWDKKHIGAIKR